MTQEPSDITVQVGDKVVMDDEAPALVTSVGMHDGSLMFARDGDPYLHHVDYVHRIERDGATYERPAWSPWTAMDPQPPFTATA